MNAEGSRAPRAAGDGCCLAPGGSPLPRRRGPGQLAASECPAAPVSAFLSAALGRASGHPPRRRWAALLLFGLLVAGAADGCDLVPRHLRGRRPSGSAGAAASPSAAAAGESQALLTGEARAAVAGRLGGIPPHPTRAGPHPRWGASRLPWRRPSHFGRLPSPRDWRLDCGFCALQWASASSPAELAVVSLWCCHWGLEGTGLISSLPKAARESRRQQHCGMEPASAAFSKGSW